MILIAGHNSTKGTKSTLAFFRKTNKSHCFQVVNHICLIHSLHSHQKMIKLLILHYRENRDNNIVTFLFLYHDLPLYHTSLENESGSVVFLPSCSPRACLSCQYHCGFIHMITISTKISSPTTICQLLPQYNLDKYVDPTDFSSLHQVCTFNCFLSQIRVQIFFFSVKG